MDNTTFNFSRTLIAAAIVTSALTAPMTAQGGAFVFAGEGNGVGVVTHPTGYSGTGGPIDVNVCIVPNSENAADIEQSVKNNIAIWNKTQSTTSNLKQILASNEADFESVALHELGHCIGLAHPNLASESGLSEPDRNFTKSTDGIDNGFNLGIGTDSVRGSGDDIRGDDVNLHYFYEGINNPFSELDVVDSTTYSNDIAGLPLGDTFAANADRTVSTLARYNSSNTEASMQQGTFTSEIQRTLGHDDVSTLRYARSGLDEVQGTADDYTVNLTYGGISDTDCDINISMNAVNTSFAVCQLGGSFIGNSDHLQIVSANAFFNPNVNWVFNDDPPCDESIAMIADVWKMVSLPCQVGVSTSATVIDVFGDDLGMNNYAVDWVVFAFEYTDQGNGEMAGAYQMLDSTDELNNTMGYWIITTESGKVIDVQGEYNSEMEADLFIDASAGQTYGWNLLGMPFRFPVVWADTLAVNPSGQLLTLQESDPIVAGGVIEGGSGTACSQGLVPSASCKVAQFAFTYNQSTEVYDLLGPTSGAIAPWDAAWVFAGDTDYALRFPMPPLEQATP